MYDIALLLRIAICWTVGHAPAITLPIVSCRFTEKA